MTVDSQTIGMPVASDSLKHGCSNLTFIVDKL